MDNPCDVHGQRLDTLEKENEDQWAALNKLRDRLPVWATLVISLLTFLLGCALTYASLVSRIVK